MILKYMSQCNHFFTYDAQVSELLQQNTAPFKYGTVSSFYLCTVSFDPLVSSICTNISCSICINDSRCLCDI